MDPILERGLSGRYGAWLLRKRPATWVIRFYAALGAALLVFSVWLWSRNIEAGALWSCLGILAIVVAHDIFVTRHAYTAIEHLETENAELRGQLGRG